MLTGKVRRMQVVPTRQQHGYGQAIVNPLLSRAREPETRRLWLDTTSRQLAAQPSYEGNGLVRFGPRQYGPFELHYYQRMV